MIVGTTTDSISITKIQKAGWQNNEYQRIPEWVYEQKRRLKMNFRLYCVVLLKKIIYENMSITLATKKVRGKGFTEQDQSRLISLIYGVLRHYYSLDYRVNIYLKKIRSRDKDIECILLSMAYQLLHTNTPQYATISENVEIARNLKKPWATSIINAIGRKILRDTSLEQERLPDEAMYEHPEWMIKMIKADWPDSWKEILFKTIWLHHSRLGR